MQGAVAPRPLDIRIASQPRSRIASSSQSHCQSLLCFREIHFLTKSPEPFFRLVVLGTLTIFELQFHLNVKRERCAISTSPRKLFGKAQKSWVSLGGCLIRRLLRGKAFVAQVSLRLVIRPERIPFGAQSQLRSPHLPSCWLPNLVSNIQGTVPRCASCRSTTLH